jgi:hypothetical protein
MKKSFINQPHSDKIVKLILNEVINYETSTIDLSDRVKFNQYQTIQINITHQNHGFLTNLAPGQEDDREFYDIITPMIETGVANTDLDTDNIDTFTDEAEYLAHELLANALIKRYNRQTNQGVVLNEMVYQFFDDGNIIVRKVDGEGELYRPVLPQNLIIVDQSARTLEDTAVIERATMNQSEVRGVKGWDNIDELFEYCDLSETDFMPYYEIFYWYGDLSKQRLGRIKKEVHGTDYKYKKGDKYNYIQSVVVIARAKKGVRNEKGAEVPGFVLFAEELKPQIINITKKLKIKRFKPYESVRLGKYNGRFWGAGYREIGVPYQNRANELGNQIRQIMKLASKMVFWSTDDEIAGKNILSAIKNGQILQAKDLYLLNNVFPNLTLFSEEWNRNINEAQKALKAFEAASGEALPSSTSATAILAQTQAIGKFYDFKRERFGLLLSIIYKRWILPEIMKGMKEDEVIEITGDVDFIDKMIEFYLKGSIIQSEMLNTALAGGVMYQENFDQLLQMKKQDMVKHPKLYASIAQFFFKGVDIFVGINVTGEGFNKQNKLSNILKMLEFEVNPNIMNNPAALDDLNEARQMLGLKANRNKPQPAQMVTNTPPTNTPSPMPTREQPPLKPNGNPNML